MKDNKDGILLNASKRPNDTACFIAMVETNMANNMKDMSFLNFLQNSKHTFEPIPVPVGTPEERFEKTLPKIEKFIEDFAIHTGAGEFFPQDTANMTQEQCLKSIEERARMAIAPLIQETTDRIASMRGDAKATSNNKKLN